MFTSQPIRCPSCRPRATEVRRQDGTLLRGWSPEATYVGYLVTTPFGGYKPAPRTCPDCGSALVPSDKEG